jgi:hypothetical protein
VAPAQRLTDDFFKLSSGVAGDIVQKFVNYRRRVVIVGDISRHVAGSSALRDFVYEANRDDHIWFVATLEGLERRRRRHLFVWCISHQAAGVGPASDRGLDWSSPCRTARRPAR